MRSQRMPIAQLLPCGLCAMLAKATSTPLPSNLPIQPVAGRGVSILLTPTCVNNEGALRAVDDVARVARVGHSPCQPSLMKCTN